MKPHTIALVITNSVQIRDSLLVLLRAIPQIEIVHQVEDGHSALDLRPEIQPALVLIDYDSTLDGFSTDLSHLKAAWPQARYLVLLDDEKDLRHVEPAGADAILVKGVRAAMVLETIEDLLSDNNPSTPRGRSQNGDL